MRKFLFVAAFCLTGLNVQAGEKSQAPKAQAPAAKGQAPAKKEQAPKAQSPDKGKGKVERERLITRRGLLRRGN
jgi:hypothetical protein